MIKFLGYICVSKMYGLYSVVDNVVSPGGQDKGVCHFLRRRTKRNEISMHTIPPNVYYALRYTYITQEFNHLRYNLHLPQPEIQRLDGLMKYIIISTQWVTLHNINYGS